MRAKWRRRILKSVLVTGLLILMGIIVSNAVVTRAAKGNTYTSTSDIPQNRVGLLLGTAKYRSSGIINLFYKHRIEAAYSLFQSGKIEYILISGDNATSTYDEPTTMRNDLVAMGIPKEKIFLDYAGFRTLDSVVRSKLIFGQDSITVISQKFHNERAIFIARRKGMTAIGFNAQEVEGAGGLKVKLREYLARVKMMMDLAFSKKPHFLGDTVAIPASN